MNRIFTTLAPLSTNIPYLVMLFILLLIFTASRLHAAQNSGIIDNIGKQANSANNYIRVMKYGSSDAGDDELTSFILVKISKTFCDDVQYFSWEDGAWWIPTSAIMLGLPSNTVLSKAIFLQLPELHQTRYTLYQYVKHSRTCLELSDQSLE